MTTQKDTVCFLKSDRANRFLYDGWNAIAELNATSNRLIRGYLWGIDLSGSLQGAGGVGGLIAVKEGTGDAHFAAYDGNGNVIALVNATTGTYSAQYEYDPFGQTIRATGPMAESNLYRFSTKYQDEEGGFYYYGYRYYNPSTGRWLNRDYLDEEAAGPAVYTYSSNNSVGAFDPVGLSTRTAQNKIIVFDQGKTIPLRWPADGSCCSKRTIGELESIFAVIDADLSGSLIQYDSSLIDTLNQILNIPAFNGGSVNTPSYIGAGLAIQYNPSKVGKICCPNPKFVAEKQGTFNGWNADGNFSGNAWGDFPGDTTSGYFNRSFGKKYHLHFYCGNTLIKTITWNYSANFNKKSNSATVTLSTPF